MVRKTDKKRNIFSPVVLAIAGAVIVGLAVLLIILLNRQEIRSDLYYYDTGVRFDAKGTSVIKNEDEQGVYLENNGADNNADSRVMLGSKPLYYTQKDKLFMPFDTTITLPSQRTVARVSKFTELENRQGNILALTGGKEYPFDEGFLYDGKNTFVFLDKVTVTYNGKAVDMAPLSYAIVVYNQRIELYPYQGEPVVEQTGTADVIANAEKGYTIDLSKCILTNAEGFESLLISEPSLMGVFEESEPFNQ